MPKGCVESANAVAVIELNEQEGVVVSLYAVVEGTEQECGVLDGESVRECTSALLSERSI